MKFFQVCEKCNKRRFKVEKIKLKIPTGDMITSKIFMCKKCSGEITKRYPTTKP